MKKLAATWVLALVAFASLTGVSHAIVTIEYLVLGTFLTLNGQPAPPTCPTPAQATQDGFRIIDGTRPDSRGKVATANNDVLYAWPAEKNYILGLHGNDVIYASNNGDIICGGPGNDAIFGGTGADLLYGDDGNDMLRGGGGADQLKGGPGNDALLGEAGFDLLEGGHGADFLDCGVELGYYEPGPGGDTIQNCSLAP